MIFKKPTDLDVIGFVDSDYASNKEDRKSISGYLVLVGRCLVSWGKSPVAFCKRHQQHRFCYLLPYNYGQQRLERRPSALWHPAERQPSVTLSSTEAEYVAASMCATEIKLVQMLMEELRVRPQHPPQRSMKTTKEPYM
jgi:hypothetical protein